MKQRFWQGIFRSPRNASRRRTDPFSCCMTRRNSLIRERGATGDEGTQGRHLVRGKGPVRATMGTRHRRIGPSRSKRMMPYITKEREAL
jgi:hypothetical protein